MIAAIPLAVVAGWLGWLGWQLLTPDRPTADSLGCLATPGASIEGTPTPMTCADSGMRPEADGFSFTNWSGISASDSIDVDTLVALFGREHVCVDDGTPECTPLPEALQWASAMNSLLMNGRCEGMSVDAERFFAGLSELAAVDASARSTADLTRSNPRLVADINYWWLTQMMPEVIDRAAASRELPPSRIVADITDGLRNGSSNTVGLYSSIGAHAVTPFAVTYDEPFFTVWVYDSNHPGSAGRIVVDPDQESWTYLSPAGPDAGEWAGTGPGGLEYTPMQARMQDFTTPFSDDPRENEYFATIVASSSDSAAEISLTIRNEGREIRTDSQEPLPEGVLTQRIDDDAAGYATVLFIRPPSRLELAATSTEPNSPVQVMIDGPLLRWQQAVVVSDDAGATPLKIVVDQQGTVDYIVTADVMVEVSTLDDGKRLVRHRIDGPATYRVESPRQEQ